MNGVVVDAPRVPSTWTQSTSIRRIHCLKGMDKRQSDEMTPSGISPRVRRKRPRDPDGNL
jgi:hypothetical protein